MVERDTWLEPNIGVLNLSGYRAQNSIRCFCSMLRFLLSRFKSDQKEFTSGPRVVDYGIPVSTPNTEHAPG